MDDTKQLQTTSGSTPEASTRTASVDSLSSLHQAVARYLKKSLEVDDVDTKNVELAIRFLKDNHIKADVRFSKPLKGIATRLPSGPQVQGLPFDVPDDTEED